jgi:hypothetical protein
MQNKLSKIGKIYWITMFLNRFLKWIENKILDYYLTKGRENEINNRKNRS